MYYCYCYVEIDETEADEKNSKQADFIEYAQSVVVD